MKKQRIILNSNAFLTSCRESWGSGACLDSRKYSCSNFIHKYRNALVALLSIFLLIPVVLTLAGCNTPKVVDSRSEPLGGTWNLKLFARPGDSDRDYIIKIIQEGTKISGRFLLNGKDIGKVDGEIKGTNLQFKLLFKDKFLSGKYKGIVDPSSQIVKGKMLVEAGKGAQPHMYSWIMKR